MNEQWRELTVRVSQSAADAVSDKLIELGTQGTVFEELPDMPGYCDVKAYYPLSLDVEELCARMTHYAEILQANDIPVGNLKITSKTIDSDDWSSQWKQYFKPTRIGEHLLIKPSWEVIDEQPDDIVIEIDPGMAFGTGLHASTRLILKFLERYLHPGNKVLDVGVGSGILSIAAARLGAAYVLGLDVDAEAVAIARENVRKNVSLPASTRLSENQIDIQPGSLDTLSISGAFDCIVMNIRPNVILPLIPYVTAYLQTGGALMISGILEEEGEELVHQIHALDFIIHEQAVEDGWIAYVLSYMSGV